MTAPADSSTRGHAPITKRLSSCASMFGGLCARSDKHALVLAALYASFVCVGLLIQNDVVAGSQYLPETSSEIDGVSGYAFVVLLGLVLFVVFYTLVRFLFRRIDKTASREPSFEQEGLVRYKQHLSQVLSKAFFLLLLCWVPYLIIRFPGNIDPDTITQLAQYYGASPASDHHPWFDTLLFGLFWDLGGAIGNHSVSLFLYVVLQQAATALAFCCVLAYMSYVKANKKAVKIAWAFYAFYPLVPLFAETMTKDSLFACIWICFLLLYVEIARSRGKAFRSRAFCGGLCLTLILLFLSKKTGMYIAVPSMILLLSVSRGYRKKLTACLMTPLVAFGVWSACLLPALGVAAGEQAELLSVPSQQVSYLLKTHGDEMTEEDYSVLEKVYASVDALVEDYNPLRADATKGQWINDAPLSDKISFFAWYLKQGIAHPLTYLKAFLALDLPAFYPYYGTPEGYNGVMRSISSAILETGSTSADIESLAQSSGLDPSVAEDMFSGFTRPSALASFSAAFDTVYEWLAALLAPLFLKSLFCLWGPLFALLYGFRSRNKMLLWMMVPVFLMVASLLAGPILLPRYIVPLVYTLPLELGLMFARARDHGTPHRRAVRTREIYRRRAACSCAFRSDKGDLPQAHGLSVRVPFEQGRFTAGARLVRARVFKIRSVRTSRTAAVKGWLARALPHSRRPTSCHVSIDRPGTRENSRSLLVTSTAPCAREVAAITRSAGPMDAPSLSR